MTCEENTTCSCQAGCDCCKPETGGCNCKCGSPAAQAPAEPNGDSPTIQ